FTHMIDVSDRNESSLCLSIDCITAASDMLTSMDPETDPCQDFYKYACGGWIRVNSIQDDESRADVYSIIRNQMSEKLKRKCAGHWSTADNRTVPAIWPVLLESPITSEDSAAIEKAKRFYISCIDLDTIEKRAERPLLDLL